MRNMRVILVGMIAAVALGAASAADLGELNKALQALIPDEKPDSVNPSPIPGLYEVVYGAQIYYLTEDGRYMLQGDMLDLQARANLTEAKRAAGRMQALNALGEDGMIVFVPKQVKHTITVFTDIDCSYCRKMHKEIAELNDLGIKVRYVAFPRAGIGSPSYDKAVSVWCAKDRQAAITRAKAEQPVEQKTCDNPVTKQFEAARKIGVSGTPSLVLEDGTLVPGYVPAQRLRELLDNKAEHA